METLCFGIYSSNIKKLNKKILQATVVATLHYSTVLPLTTLTSFPTVLRFGGQFFPNINPRGFFRGHAFLYN